MLLISVVLSCLAFVFSRAVIARERGVNRLASICLGVAFVIVYFSGLVGARDIRSAAIDSSGPAELVPATAETTYPKAADHFRDVSSSCADASLVSTVGVGNLEGIRDRKDRVVSKAETILSGDDLAAYGWAANAGTGENASSVCLVIDGKLFLKATSLIGSARPDVVAALKTPRAMNSGFVIRFAAKNIGAGRHSVQVAEQVGDKTFAVVNGSFDVSIR